ncbi:DNA starvation/stationary phase protection protein [uncultured Limimaricola sp.]|uniref:Dps family protein n=1 Tax=uncultured Limimaricola sp. TaxID=2211667 RepID=UPI0030FB041A
MADNHNVKPSADKVDTGVEKAKQIADGLSQAVADTYRMVFKTHAYHWNVEGPLFYSVHKLTEEQYNDMFQAADEMAERIRALGQLTPSTLKHLEDLSIIKDKAQLPSAVDMCEDLASSHEQVAKRMHDLIELADENGDPVTADMITARSQFHEQAAWMLRAIAK